MTGRKQMFSLHDLDGIIADRAMAEDGTSYTASLLAKGLPVCARKFGEEAVETVVAATSGSADEVAAEAADTLYHLLVLLRARNVPLESVMAELQSRRGQSGLQEKAARSKPE